MIRPIEQTRLNPPTTNQPEGHLMQTIKERLVEVGDTATTFVSFLRAMVAARMAPLLGDERGEIALGRSTSLTHPDHRADPDYSVIPSSQGNW